jgi:hypothetical protein
MAPYHGANEINYPKWHGQLFATGLVVPACPTNKVQCCMHGGTLGLLNADGSISCCMHAWWDARAADSSVLCCMHGGTLEPLMAQYRAACMVGR